MGPPGAEDAPSLPAKPHAGHAAADGALKSDLAATAQQTRQPGAMVLASPLAPHVAHSAPAPEAAPADARPEASVADGDFAPKQSPAAEGAMPARSPAAFQAARSLGAAAGNQQSTLQAAGQAATPVAASAGLDTAQSAMSPAAAAGLAPARAPDPAANSLLGIRPQTHSEQPQQQCQLERKGAPRIKRARSLKPKQAVDTLKAQLAEAGVLHPQSWPSIHLHYCSPSSKLTAIVLSASQHYLQAPVPEMVMTAAQAGGACSQTQLQSPQPAARVLCRADAPGLLGAAAAPWEG